MSLPFFVKNSVKTKRGFTLVELLVSISLFTLVILIAIGTLLNLASINDRSQAVLVALNNLDFAMEQMARNLRTGSGYYQPTGQGSIEFKDAKDKIVRYFLETDPITGSGIIRRTKDGLTLDMTAPEINIQYMNYYIDGTPETGDAGFNKQPRVLLTIGGRTTVKNLKDNEQAEFHLQTYVSQRNPDLGQ